MWYSTSFYTANRPLSAFFEKEKFANEYHRLERGKIQKYNKNIAVMVEIKIERS